jgi:hypothetical protein
MNKHIIISGPTGSGKSHIAEALKLTTAGNIYTLSAKSFISKLEDDLSKFILDKFTLMIIDECGCDDISLIHKIINERGLSRNILGFTRLVFLTREDPLNRGIQSLDASLFHVIYTDWFSAKRPVDLAKLFPSTDKDSTAQSVKIKMNLNGKECAYDSDTKLISHTTKHNVVVTCETPPHWGIIRVFQFMESLLKADLI